jgi:hypothetical protein
VIFLNLLKLGLIPALQFSVMPYENYVENGIAGLSCTTARSADRTQLFETGAQATGAASFNSDKATIEPLSR